MARVSILGTGLTGLVGSRIVELLKDRYQFENISRKTGVDITDKEAVKRKIGNSSAQIILHAAAKTDVDKCEEDKSLGNKGEAWLVNVEGTRNIVDAAKKSGKKIILISTDFIFDGKKENSYSEDDLPAPVNWYGQTKTEAEKVVQNSKIPFVIARIAYPYRAKFDKKEDFVRAIRRRLLVGKSIAGITDHIMTPTFIDDIAYALRTLIESNAIGVYQVVGSQMISPHQACLLITKVFNSDNSLIKETTRKDYFRGKAQRPFRLALNNDKITQLGVTMRTFEEGLMEMRKQEP